MLFNSFQFIVFFIVVTSLYFSLPHRYRWFLLLSASCYFYMAFVPVYILILGFTIVIDYFAGIWIEQSSGRKRKRFLVMSLIANIGVLAMFKYYNFLNENLTTLLHGSGFENPIPFLKILLPIGLSFHTFQAMSYTIEVYRGNQKAERHFGIYALYVMFYPQLVAGPIERPQNILHQFRIKHSFSAENFKRGIKLMIRGFFMKVVVADRIAPMVDQVFNDIDHYYGFQLILATVLFTIQIYCDFAGYSDIALGTARVMGFDLMTNFNRPYLSSSVREFWSRWHISLSTWFRDYLYIPLGGNRNGKVKMYYYLFLTFLISGVWHGAKWTFIVWGALHGFYLVSERILLKNRQPRFNIFRLMLTFTLVSFAWMFFRANSMHDSVVFLQHVKHFSATQFSLSMFSPAMEFGFYLALVFIAFLFIYEILMDKSRLQPEKKIFAENICMVMMVLLIITGGTFSSNDFVYFQF